LYGVRKFALIDLHLPEEGGVGLVVALGLVIKMANISPSGGLIGVLECVILTIDPYEGIVISQLRAKVTAKWPKNA
jgi:hypothetical protein